MTNNKNKRKKKTAVFIDHESWFYGMRNVHGQETDVDKELGKIEEENEVVFKKGFGNLPDMRGSTVKEEEEGKLDKWGYDMEYTFEGNIKGDLTDFVVVDSMYRMLMDNERNDLGIEKIILISGDAHYLQTLRTMRREGLDVEVWAVYGTLSNVFEEFNTRIIYPEEKPEIVYEVKNQIRVMGVLSSAINKDVLVDKVVTNCSGYDKREVEMEVDLMCDKGVVKKFEINTKKKKKPLVCLDMVR